MFLEQIVTNINDAIVSKLQNADINLSLHGISKKVPRTSNDPQIADDIPLYVDNTGEGSFNAVDDRFAMCIYHKCNSLNFATTEGFEFGDGEDFETETANMSVFIWGDRRKLKMTQETVLSIAASALPTSLSQSFITGIAGLTGAFVSSVSSSNDSLLAWGNEFGNTPYPLPPEQFFVELTYTIQTTIQKSCIEICAEC